jgi:hypothetical protein
MFLHHGTHETREDAVSRLHALLQLVHHVFWMFCISFFCKLCVCHKFFYVRMDLLMSESHMSRTVCTCISSTWTSTKLWKFYFTFEFVLGDCLCGLEVSQSSWLQIGLSSISSTTRFFWEVLGLVWGTLGLVSTTDELLGRKSSGFGLGNWEHSCRDAAFMTRHLLSTKIGTNFAEKWR